MRFTSNVLRAACAAAALGLVPVLGGCGQKKAEAAPIETVPVGRQNVVVDVEATGVIQPIGAVDVRSKTSGQIVQMPVQTGSVVKPGDLLVRIDPRDAQNRYNQARAAVLAARAQVEVSKAQYDRNSALAQQGVITAPEVESSRIAFANARSQIASAETQLELAQISLEDVTITAPSAGVIIATNVVPGQVIASSTNSPSGGTILMTLANLGTVYDSTLVNESDIGKVKPGQTATVTVDAYPNRTFRGVVEKIEPRATVQQSVTMFPVKIRIDNMDGALMPGMNSDVSILVDTRADVLAVPVDAVRPTRDAMTAAMALGLDSSAVREMMQSQMGGRGTGGPAGGDTGAGVGVAVAATAGGAPQQGGQGGRGAQGGPPPSAAACDSVTRAFAAKPALRARLDSLTAAMRGGAGDMDAARAQMRAIYDSLGIDARSARACRGGGAGGQGAAAGAGGAGGGAAGAAVPGGSGRGRTASLSRGIVFVQNGTAYEPRLVQLGLSNFDYVEIVSGLREGERVALVSGAVQAQNRQNLQNRMRGNGLPGSGGPGGGGRPGGGGGRGG